MQKSEVYNMCCIEGLKHYPDKYFDLAVVDPPYGIDELLYRSSYGKAGNALRLYSKNRWDVKPTYEYFTELFRVSKNQIVWGGNYFTSQLPENRCWICWNKDNPATNFSSIELAWTSFDLLPEYFYYAWGGLADGIKGRNKKEKSVHPTQKPVSLYDWIFQKFAGPGQRILDTHLGSQSSRIAAHKNGLEFVGFEIDKEYYEAGCKRYEEYLKQPTLFQMAAIADKGSVGQNTNTLF